MNDNINEIDPSKKKINKKNKVPLLILLALILIGTGTTYALWQLTFTQSGTNIITTGCFQIEFADKNPITLTDAYPMSDDEGKKLTPYELKITNTCNSKANYYINLETITKADKKLNEEYLKASLRKKDTEVFFNNLNPSFINLDKVIEEASSAFKIYEGTLNAKEEVTFYLNLWLDENTDATDDIMEASYEGKVTILTSYKSSKENNNNMIALENTVDEWNTSATLINLGYTQNRKYHINKVVYQSEINPYSTAVEVVDFSINQDKSILGYYVKCEDSDSYDLYIQADGKIKLNSNGENYGLVESHCTSTCSGSSVEGIENWDTSLVTNMYGMFMGAGNESLDLSHFDTSKVTNMGWMFAHMNYLTSLNLSSFDTSKVTNMSDMFKDCGKLTTTINITNPNIENYDGMFSNAATEEGAQITVNYTAETESLVEQMIATKSENSNVVKGTLIP